MNLNKYISKQDFTASRHPSLSRGTIAMDVDGLKSKLGSS